MSTVAAAELRFDVDETIALVRQRFGADFDAGVAVRLHEMADGWPLGLQLALAVAAADRDPQAAAEALLRQSGSLQHRLVGMLLANLDPADLAFLVRLSVLEDLTPALAAAVGAEADAAGRLRRIAATTRGQVETTAAGWCVRASAAHGPAIDRLRITLTAAAALALSRVAILKPVSEV